MSKQEEEEIPKPAGISIAQMDTRALLSTRSCDTHGNCDPRCAKIVVLDGGNAVACSYAVNAFLHIKLFDTVKDISDSLKRISNTLERMDE